MHIMYLQYVTNKYFLNINFKVPLHVYVQFLQCKLFTTGKQ